MLTICSRLRSPPSRSDWNTAALQLQMKAMQSDSTACSQTEIFIALDWLYARRSAFAYVSLDHSYLPPNAPS